jgi:hypothetical protein
MRAVRVAVDPRIRANHDVVRSLVLDGFAGVDATGVEVRVEPAGRPSRSFAGRAYPSVPKSARASGDVRYLVRLFLPVAPRNASFPRTYRYRRLRTAPAITVGDWRQALLAVAAHEACHIRQFRDGSSRSEVEAERWSKRVLQTWVDGEVRRASVPVTPGRPDCAVQLALAFG